ncbi:MAG TPA: universal stress protein [Baekduia sp.]|nr:universal stress protein [Baekduia sp.]
MTDTILVAAHGPDAADAVALGADLARLHAAQLVLVGIYVVPAGPYARAFEHAARQALQRDLDALAAAVPGDVGHATLLHASSSVVRGLRELAESHDADALVLGPSHRGPVGRVVHGDTTAALLHGAPCAVAVAPRGWARAGRHLGERVVGVAWDDGPEARIALDAAARIAERTGAELKLISVVEPLPRSSALDFPDDEALARSRRETATAAAEEAAAAVAGRCTVETIVLDGIPAGRALVDAGPGLDVLVMGSRAYGPLRRVLFGSVSTHVVHAAACPVLVLPRGASTEPDAGQERVAEHAAG